MMTPREFAPVDRDLDALDPTRSVAAKGRSVAMGAMSSRLDEVDAWLTELGGPIERASGVTMREPPPPPRQASDDSIFISTLVPPPPLPPTPGAPDVGVDTDLSFDDLFEDEALPAAESEPLATMTASVPPARREHEALERVTRELDDEELAALDSLEISIDD